MENSHEIRELVQLFEHMRKKSAYAVLKLQVEIEEQEAIMSKARKEKAFLAARLDLLVDHD